jgi:hypothetical protein
MADTETLSYTERRIIEHGRELLGDLLDRDVVKESGLADLFREAAEQAYWTIHEDSYPIKDGMGLMALKEPWEKGDATKREAITLALDRFFINPRGNWIVRGYVADFAKKIGLGERYKC